MENSLVLWNLLAVVRKELTNLCLSLRVGSGRLPGMGALCLSENFLGGLILSKGLFCHWDFSMLWKCRLVGTSARNTKHCRLVQTPGLWAPLSRNKVNLPNTFGYPVGKAYITAFSYLTSSMMTWQGRRHQMEYLLLQTLLKVILLFTSKSLLPLIFQVQKQNKTHLKYLLLSTDGVFFLCSCILLKLVTLLVWKIDKHPVSVLLQTIKHLSLFLSKHSMRIYSLCKYLLSTMCQALQRTLLSPPNENYTILPPFLYSPTLLSTLRLPRCLALKVSISYLSDLIITLLLFATVSCIFPLSFIFNLILVLFLIFLRMSFLG